jgi:hypothetical protein
MFKNFNIILDGTFGLALMEYLNIVNKYDGFIHTVFEAVILVYTLYKLSRDKKTTE